MDGRKGFRRLREPPPGTRSSRRGRRAHDLTAGGGGRGRGRVKENPYLNHPPPHHHHHENLEYSRRGQDQGYNDGYEGTDYHHSYGPGQADSSGDSGYNSLHQPPGEAHLSSNPGVPATALEAGLMLLTEWASNLTHGTSSYNNQPASEDSYHERSLPRLRGEDHSEHHHDPIPPLHRAEAQYDENYRSSFRPDAARDFVGHGYIPVMHDDHRAGHGRGRGRVLLDTPREYDSGREEYVPHRREGPRGEMDYEGQFDRHYADDGYDEGAYADDRVDYRPGDHAQQGLITRSNGKRHATSMEESYDFGKNRHASGVGFDDRHDGRHDGRRDGRHRHFSDVNFDGRHRHASDMGFGHDDNYNSSDQQYPPYHYEHGDSTGPMNARNSHTPTFHPDFHPGDRPMKRKRSSSDKRKPDLPPKRSRVETHDDHLPMIGSQHPTGPHSSKYISSTFPPKKPLLNRLGPFSAEGRDSAFDFAECKDLSVPARLGPSPIQSRLGPKQEVPPLLPDLRTRLNGRGNDSPIPLFPSLPSPDPLIKPLRKTSSKEKPLPDLSVPDFLKPGSSGNSKISLIHNVAVNKATGKLPGCVPATPGGVPATPGCVPAAPGGVSAAGKLPGCVPVAPSGVPATSKSPSGAPATGKSPVGVPAAGKSIPAACQNQSKGAVTPPSTMALKSPGLQPIRHVREGVVSKLPPLTSQKKNVKIVKVVQKSSPKDPVPVTVGSNIPSGGVPHHVPPPEPSVEANQQLTGQNTTEPVRGKLPVHANSDATGQHRPLPLLRPILSDSNLKKSGPEPQPSLPHPLQASVSDPRLKGRQLRQSPSHTKLSDLRLKGSQQQHQSSPPSYHQQEHNVEKPPHVPATRKQQPLLQQPQQLSCHEPQLLPPQQECADPVLSEQGQVAIDPGSQQQPQLVARRSSITAVVSNVAEDTDSGKESDDCGLVIDEEAYLCDSESSEDEIPKPAVLAGEHPAIRRPAEESSEGHLTVWDSEGDISAAGSERKVRLPAAAPGRAGDTHTDRKTLRIACSMLSRTFIQQLNNEGNLLQKLYDAMKILVRFMNGRDAWHLRFVRHIRKMFHSYCIGSARSPTKLMDQFRLELKHLRSLCGVNVLLWQEQIQRFSLLALTFPKNKEDKRMEGFAESVLVTGIKSGKEVIVISDDDDDEGSWPKGAGREGAPLLCTLSVKSEPAMYGSESPRPKESGAGNARGVGIDQSIRQSQPVVREVTMKPTGIEKPGEGSSGVSRSARLGSTVEQGVTDKEGSDGECSMSVCSTLSNNFDEDEGRPQQQQAGECGPDLRRWAHAHELLVCQQERCSVELHNDADGGDVSNGGGKGAKAIEKTPPQPPGRPPSPEMPPLPPSPPTPPRPPTPVSPVRAASLSPGELTPTPPPSPKPMGRSVSESSTSASVHDLPNKDRVSASRSSQHVPPRRKVAKPSRSHAYKPTSYRSPPPGASRSRARFPRKSRSRSRDRYERSRRSRSPIVRSRPQRASRSPLGRTQGRGGRRRSLTPIPDRGSKVKQQRKKLEEEDLELLRLKKEVILSIVKRPGAAQASSAATSTGKNTPPLQSTRVDTTSTSASKDTSSVSKAPSSASTVLPLFSAASVSSKTTSPLPSARQSISSLSSAKQRMASQTRVTSSKPIRRGSAPLPISSRDSSSSAQLISSDKKSNPSLPSSSKDTPPSSKEAALTSQVSEVIIDDEHLPSGKPSTQSVTSTRSLPTTNLSSDGQVSILAKKLMTGLAKKAIAKTLENRNLSPSAGGRSALSSVNSSRVSSRVASPVGSPSHVPAALSPHSSEEASGRTSSSGSVKPTASAKVCPGRENTWKIQPFHITSSGAESDSGGEGKGEVGLSEIGAFLAEARRTAAAQASVSSSGKTTTSSMEELDLPSPPANLSRNQQQEYMQLKRKLALHEKKRLRDPKSLGGTSTGMKITKGVASKPPLPVSRPSPSHSGCSTPPLPVSRPSPSHSGCSTPPLTTSHSPEVMDNALLAKSAEKEAEERNALVLECQRKISGTAEKLKGTRAHEEEEQQQITSLTNQLTECVSEIVEHEQVMVRVQQQLALLRREQEMVDVALRGCEERIGALQDRVRSAQQKKAECTAEAKEYEHVLAEQEKELKLLQSGKQALAVPTVEYENVSDSEISSVPSRSATGGQPEYEAISDSECVSVPGGERLAVPVLQVEPISDTEDGDVAVLGSSPMETDNVGGPVVGTMMMRSIIQFPPADIESITETGPEVEVGALRDHDYCRCKSNYASNSLAVATGPDGADPGPDGDDPGDVLSPLLDGDIYFPLSVETVACGHEDPVPPNPLPCYLVMSEEDDQDLSVVSGEKALPVVRQQKGVIAPTGTQCPDTVSGEGGQRSSPALDNALQLAMEGALNPTLRSLGQLQPPAESPCVKKMVKEDEKDHERQPSNDGVEPLLKSVVVKLTRESLNDMLSRDPVCVEDLASASPSSSCHELDANLEDYFHPCHDNSFTHAAEEPPSYVVPRQAFTQDLSLAVQPSSISTAAMQALQASAGCKSHVTAPTPAREEESGEEDSDEFMAAPKIVSVEGSRVQTNQLAQGPPGMASLASDGDTESGSENTLLTRTTPQPAIPPVLLGEMSDAMEVVMQRQVDVAEVTIGMSAVSRDVTPPPDSFPSLARSPEAGAEGGVVFSEPVGHTAMDVCSSGSLPPDSSAATTSAATLHFSTPFVVTPMAGPPTQSQCVVEEPVIEQATVLPQITPAIKKSNGPGKPLASTGAPQSTSNRVVVVTVLPGASRAASSRATKPPPVKSKSEDLQPSVDKFKGRQEPMNVAKLQPATIKVASPTTSKTAMPTAGKAAPPTTSKTATPTAGKAAPPTTNKTATPTTGKAVPPTTSKTATPTAGKAAPLTTNKTATPTTGKAAPPTTSKTATPTAGKAAPPTTSKMAIPTTGKVAPPTTGKTAMPTTGKTAMPTTGKTAMPTTGRVAPPGKVAPPTTSKTATPTTGKVAPPTTSKTAIPTTGKVAPPTTGKTAKPTTGKVAPPTTSKTAIPTTGKVAPPTTSKTAIPTTGKVAPPTTSKTAMPTTTTSSVAGKATSSPTGKATIIKVTSLSGAASKAAPSTTIKVSAAATKVAPSKTAALAASKTVPSKTPAAGKASKTSLTMASKSTFSKTVQLTSGKAEKSLPGPASSRAEKSIVVSSKLVKSVLAKQPDKSAAKPGLPDKSQNSQAKSQPAVSEPELAGKSDVLVTKVVKRSLQDTSKLEKTQPVVSAKSAHKPAGPDATVAMSQPSTSKELPSSACARTSGWVKPKAPPPVVQATSATAEGNSVMNLIMKILSVKDFPKALAIDSASSTSTEAVTGGNHSSLFSLLANNYMTPSLLPPPTVLPESILSEIDTSSQATALATSHAPSGYQPYSSPLLMFTSYRLNPAFRSLSKIPLGSLTYSSKLDPHKVMCMYELKGVCSNPKCTAQHIRDLEMEKEEVVRDLVSYAPTLAGCTAQELAMAAADQPQVADAIAGKISSYSAELMDKYGDKVSSEELFRLTVYEANTERVKTKKKNFVFLEDRPWTEGVVQGTPRPRGFQLDVTGAGVAAGPEQSEQGKGLTAGTLAKVEERRRYFTKENDTPVPDSDQGSSNQLKQDAARKLMGPARTLAPGGDGDPPPSDQLGTSEEVVAAAQQLISEKQFIVASTMLEKAIETYKDSEDVWILHLRLQSQLASSAELPELYKLFHVAVSVCQSYAVIWETIRLARCYKSKLKAVCDGLQQLRRFSHVDPAVLSTLCLELFVNAILLDLLIRKPSVALRHFDQARVSLESTSAASFKGILDVLVQREKLLFSLCHLCVLYMDQLPSCLFSADTHHTIPARLCHFQPFAVPFDRANELSNRDYKQVLRAFKLYFDLYQPQSRGDESSSSSFPRAEFVEQNLPLYKNLVLFEAAHGNNQKAVNMLRKLITVCPHIPDLWHTLPRMRELSGMDCMADLEQATSTCPRKPGLYYFAARLELSRASSEAGASEGEDRNCEAAVQWLVKCVRNYYTELPQQLSTKEVLILYRKLLNQLIGYNQSIPALAEGVDPRGLGDQLAPLWMCYCLLVELTVPPSSPATPGAELFHPSAEEAYESALHTVQSAEGHQAIWREYILYVRAKGVETTQGFRRLMNCVQRCVLDVPWTRPMMHPLPLSDDAVVEDHSFHNEMIAILMACLPSSSSVKLSLLRKFNKLLPKNSELLGMMVRCALQQNPPCSHIAQSSLAEYLSLHPCSPHMWKLAIETELQLKHTREARWMFNKALESVPIYSKLWIDFLVFELNQAAASSSSVGANPDAVPPATLQRIIALVRNAHQYGVDLVSVLRQLANKAS